MRTNTILILFPVILGLLAGCARPEHESKYIDHLLKARDYAVSASGYWKDMQLVKQFPNGPHWRSMSADDGIYELDRLRSSLNRIEPAMNNLYQELALLEEPGLLLVEENPNLTAQHQDLLDAGLSEEIQNINELTAPQYLTRIINKIDTMLKELGVQDEVVDG